MRVKSPIPTGWKEYKIADLAIIDENSLSNGTPKNYSFKYISLADVNRGIINDNLIEHKYSVAPSRARRSIKENDILMSTVRPNLEGFARIKRKIDDTIASTGFAVISPIIESDSEYIHQYLYSFEIRRQIYALVVGSNYPAINSTEVKCLRILAPISPTARAQIGEMLLTWDTVIEKMKRLIEAKEKQFSCLTKLLINAHCTQWKHLQTEKIFKNVSEKNNGNEELLSVTQDRGVIPRAMLEGRVMSPEGSTDAYKLIREGDFAISLRSFQGGIEYSRYHGLISPAYTILRPKLKIHDEFYRHFFKTYLFIEKYLGIAVIGIRDGKQISIPDVMTVKIPYPSLQQQKQIASVFNTSRQEIDLLKKQAEAYRKQKRGLMQKLLTGHSGG